MQLRLVGSLGKRSTDRPVEIEEEIARGRKPLAVLYVAAGLDTGGCAILRGVLRRLRSPRRPPDRGRSRPAAPR